MSETWLAQRPTFAPVALLVTAMFFAGRLVQGVGLEQGQMDMKAGLATLTTRMETLFADPRGDLGGLRRDLADVRERLAAIEAREATAH